MSHESQKRRDHSYRVKDDMLRRERGGKENILNHIMFTNGIRVSSISSANFKRKQTLIYKIKTMLYDLINNANVIRFDYDYYNQVVDRPDFPYRGDLDLAKRVFSLYIGENSLVRLDAKEIKQKLGLSMSSRAISSMIDRLVLAVFKYKEGIRKENSFSLREIKDFYRNNSNNLSSEEIALFKDFFDKYLNSGCKISEDLIYLMLKDKFSDHFDISKRNMCIF